MKKIKRTHCKHGHDLRIVGVNKRGNCKECKRLADIAYRNTERGKEILNKSRLRWAQSPKGKKITKIYRNSPKGKQVQKVSNKKWRWSESGKESTRRSNSKRAAKKLEWQRRWREENRELSNKMARDWRNDHPEIVKLLNLQNHSERKLRIPNFGQDNILIIYKICPKAKEVDHYIPLQGDLVSGLHVEWNLQYLTPKQNRLKHNKVNLLEASERYGKLLEKEGLK